MKQLTLWTILSLFTFSLMAQDGSLDTSFGDGGKVVTSIGPKDDILEAIAVQSDGKIIAVGRAQNDPFFKFAVVRYEADGTLDSSFGTNGIVGTAIGSLDDSAMDVTLQTDGKILVTGHSFTTGTNVDFVLNRYNTDGTLDTSFGSNGAVVTDISVPDDFAHAVQLQADGKILVSGYTRNETTDMFSLVRYNTDGSLDQGFGENGVVVTSLNLLQQRNKTLAIQADGKIVIAGYGYNNIDTDFDFVIVRYHTDGGIDTTFGENGVVITTISDGTDEVTALKIQADGKIVVGGYSYISIGSNERDFVIARYLENGYLDPFFSEEGFIITDLGDNDDVLLDLVIQADGKIIATGVSDPEFGGLGDDFSSCVLVRYDGNGFLDDSFGDAGVVHTTFMNQTNIGQAIALQADNKIVMGGFVYNGEDFDFAIARYNNTAVVSTNAPTKSSMDINVFPNPTQDYINIEASLVAVSEVVIQVYNVQGQLVLLEEYPSAIGEQNYKIPCQNWTKGTYFITIETSIGQERFTVEKF